MDEAAPQAARGKTSGGHDLAAISETLQALRLAWGDTYTFGHDDGYWAERLDRPGGLIRAGSPGELGGLLLADFEAGQS